MPDFIYDKKVYYNPVCDGSHRWHMEDADFMALARKDIAQRI